MLNKNLLKSKMALKGVLVKELAQKIDMNYNNFSAKFCGKTEFRPSEINAIKNVLALTDSEVVEIFVNN